jgi:hypothetical protein
MREDSTRLPIMDARKTSSRQEDPHNTRTQSPYHHPPPPQAGRMIPLMTILQ